MSKTPEGRIKDATTKFLIAEGLCPSKDAANVKIDNSFTGWFHMPVQAFHGVMGQNDYHGHYKGRYFGIETKVPGKDPTPLQMHQILAINHTGAVSFVVRTVEDLMWVKAWMQKVDRDANYASDLEMCYRWFRTMGDNINTKVDMMRVLEAKHPYLATLDK